jgi:hypothetical protein
LNLKIKFMERIELPDPDHIADGLSETMFLPSRKVGYKLTRGTHCPELSDLDDLLVVAHGLPGVQWWNRMEHNARLYISGNEPVRNLGVMFLVPGGLKDVHRNLGADPFNMGGLRDFVQQNFDFEAYIKSFADTLGEVVGDMNDDANLHLAGHSCGTTVLAHGLHALANEGVEPTTVSFMAPFVAVSLADGVDDRFMLDIFADGQKHSVDEAKDRANIFLGDCRRFYHVDDLLMEKYVDLFRQDFMERMHATLFGFTNTRWKIMRGDKDDYIGDAQSELLRSGLLAGRHISEHTYHNDGHELRSVAIPDLIC